MSEMKRIQTAIDDYCGKDEEWFDSELHEIITNDINEHFHEMRQFEDLRWDSQYILLTEQEDREDRLSKLYEDQYKLWMLNKSESEAK